MPYSRAQLFELSKKVGRSWRTLQYWSAQGCDLNDPDSLQRFLEEKNRKQTNVQKLGSGRTQENIKGLQPNEKITFRHLGRFASLRRWLAEISTMATKSDIRRATATWRAHIRSRRSHRIPPIPEIGYDRFFDGYNRGFLDAIREARGEPR
jgi:hypothetical protein